MTVSDMMTACGGRRFLMTMGCGIANTALVALHLIPPDVYRDLILGTVGVFIGAATYQHVATIRAPQGS
ncbi:MAG TPA: hypothetical protein VFA39_15580 [Steroidobacteraceae bacterium]|nr:hypothetical protein [Steroidobacteraceae bacterium]